MKRKKIRRIVVKSLGERDAASVCRYITESGRDAREGSGSDATSPLFSGEGEGATVGGVVRHFVVSVKPDHNLLHGLSDGMKAERLRALTRRLVRAAVRRSGEPTPLWVAGVHLNTEVPHVHVAVRV